MGHHHHSGDHHGHHHGHSHFVETREGNKKGLIIALMITAGIMLLEFFGGLVTNSLALLSDAGHMLSDTSSLILSLFAIWFAQRPASRNKTYGFYRFEILAALFNGLTLFIISGIIVWEAYGRFFEPPTVASGSMMVIAAIGLIANLISAWSLIRKSDIKNNVNLRSAYLHILGDALGSVGAIIAGALMLLFDWYIADPIISVIVALLILKSAWGVIKQSIHILMEGTPITIDQSEVESYLKQINGVINVHDLHIWTITSGLDSLSCHLLVEEHADTQEILQRAIDLIKDKFQIEHTTIQIETKSLNHSDLKI
ncbi:cation diffusion facilitator family transporter [Heyndrickxia oleronia]|jgi:cobalt-zinc-cadmium efflux system protein|uniref:cation diffusion facilitator family transporter n=1 Tax=Heyndrickxia oleronia TaxID=38875 RepID=UPI002432E3F3|nr:cation diffusion facilitator family transporter [Heyndrickxia oleronia]MCI1589975.1 cation diffusion facilitator family transporter [Heyndrickxia oleronia]MCI1613399.1 cation diffusion facilitator family transporter [Heyndrickxia oleronia]MCI1744693.1 cation diffusion facilitator family transporter [Heyndrickxia oleronia]MCI1761348.1 cation diffusion facilitator family transporter [Heyndrickxia oleronia]